MQSGSFLLFKSLEPGREKILPGFYLKYCSCQHKYVFIGFFEFLYRKYDFIMQRIYFLLYSVNNVIPVKFAFPFFRILFLDLFKKLIRNLILRL